MNGGNNVKNCRIIIKDLEHEETVADTYITGYDWSTNTVRISAASLNGKKYTNISALIFGKDGFYEYFGKINKADIANETVVALYSGQERKGRATRRYKLYAQGDVTHIKIENVYVGLQKPIPFSTLNISANGLLIRTYTGCFKKNDRICLRVLLDNREFKMECRVIRLHSSAHSEEEYGCKIISIQSDMERLVKINANE